MKGILVLLDGLGDLPCKQLNDKTPLEAAETPNLDFFSARGEMGYMYPLEELKIPESHESILSIFGNDTRESSRGQLEARGADIKLVRGDLALRANFATIDSLKEGNIIDRRVGRTLTTEEAKILAKEINKIKIPCEFIFKPTIQHRGVLVLRGGFSDNITSNDRFYSEHGMTKNKISIFKPADDEENTKYTVNVLNEFMEKVYYVLENHPVNIQRKKKGLLPANFLLMRGAGIEQPKLKFYRRWMAIAYMPLEIGFAKLSGMKVFSFDYPRLKNFDVYENLNEGLKEACEFTIKTIKKNYKDFDYAYVHIKETDIPGHDNKPIEKKNMIEYIDKTLFKFLKEFAALKGIKILVTGDHSTPCKLKSHSTDPVPVLFYNMKIKIQRFNFFPVLRKKEEKPLKEIIKFSEKNARLGSLGRIYGNQLLSITGFN
ncbi:MAG: phosphoglycerate mutase [Candidatus Pacearchaeota archaeon]|nr:MAG: phosphoglycerate mutase [Candidatus Pacearchaeota archaeon]